MARESGKDTPNPLDHADNEQKRINDAAAAEIDEILKTDLSEEEMLKELKKIRDAAKRERQGGQN